MFHRQENRQEGRTDRQENRHDGDWDNGWGGWVDNPIAAGMVIGATAMWTAAVVGSYWYALPYGCPPWYWGGFSYYSCGGSYYRPIYEGDTVVYVTVDDPSQGQQQPGPLEPTAEQQQQQQLQQAQQPQGQAAGGSDDSDDSDDSDEAEGPEE